jgi:pyridoxamine 5'-phosphate oxidase
MRGMQATDELLPDALPAEPMRTLAEWLGHATQQRLQPNPNAMVLATTTPDGRPSARVVLCKDVAVAPGYVVFYTNYRSRKGRELADNPRAAAVIHWDALHRQIRLEGTVTPATPEQSDAYFASRPWQSRLGAWASDQSQPIGSRADMARAVAEAAQRLGVPDPATGAQEAAKSIPRPPHWGGYQLWLDSVELWVEGVGRVHDRARWTRRLDEDAAGQFSAGPWSATRLQP